MTRKRSSNQEIEEYYFQQFCLTRGISPDFIQHRDKPDIIIKIDHHTIGVEVTNFYIKDGSDRSSEQRQAPLRETIVQDAQKLYLKNNGKNIEVTFGFNTIKDTKGIAEQIADFVQSIDNKTGMVAKNTFAHIPELASVYYNATEYEDAQWRAMQVHSPPFLDQVRLKDIIKEKESKAAQYQRCDSFWLLIVIDYINFGQEQHILQLELEKVPSSTFEKIFLYKTGYEQIIEVQQ